MTVRILLGCCLDRLRELPEESVHCVVTSPPYYGLRDYGVPGQLGLEPTLSEYLDNMVAVFREVRRVLRNDGTLWLNIGDSYNSIGHKKSGSGYGSTGLAGGIAQEHHPLGRETGVRGLKHKDLIGVPWRLAFALQADGWWLRQDIIWHKPNPMPESVRDRCTKAHEYIFLLANSERYYYNQDAIREPHTTEGENSGEWERNTETSKHAVDADGKMRTRPGSRPKDYIGNKLGRNKRDVWTITTKPYAESHFATFPPDLIEPCILAGCPIGGTVLDPFLGSGTTAMVADRLQRDCIGIELNPEYAAMAARRIRGDAPLFADVA